MRRLALLLPLLAGMCAAPAMAQRPSIAGCGTVAVARADRANEARLEAAAACFDSAAAIATGAADARRALLAELDPPAPPVPPTPPVVPPVTPPAPGRNIVGINTAGFTYYSGVNIFANLLYGSNSWLLAEPGKPTRELTAAEMDGGWVRSLPAGASAARMLSQPYVPEGGLAVRCTWQGKGTLGAGNVRDLVRGDRQMTFRMTARWPVQENMWLSLSATDPADPVRDIDCRAADVPADAVFDPAYVQSLQGYAALRFMAWAWTNENASVTWATRNRLGDGSYHGADGAPIEAYVDLVKRVPGADPWFNVLWNADDDYVRRLAIYLRDNVPADRRIYVETSNEVWNALFPVARQAQAEGVAARLSDNPFQSQLHRYAQRSTEVMKIFTEVFAGQERRLVRVIATQHANPWTAEVVLGFRDTARFHDALATAPYFGYDITGITVDAIFPEIERGMEQSLVTAVRNKAIADRFGQRYLSYENGQHVILHNDVALNRRLQTDPRMGALYRRHIDGWRALTGDLYMQFVDFSPVSQWGAWGLQEYLGQPIEQAPKAQAVRAAIGR